MAGRAGPADGYLKEVISLVGYLRMFDYCYYKDHKKYF